MNKELLKLAYRNLKGHLSSSLINIIGLSVSIACGLVILLYIINEATYDSFHRNADDIYRIYSHTIINGLENIDARSPFPMAPTIKSEIPEVLKTVRLTRPAELHISVDQKNFKIDQAFYADSSFFDLFTFGLIHGDASSVLSAPNSVVLSETAAKRIFQNNNPVNKLIRFGNDSKYYRITGVSKDAPNNSHFEFDLIISMESYWDKNSSNWSSNNFITYVQLQPDASFADAEMKLSGTVEKYLGPLVKQALGVSLEEFNTQGNMAVYLLQPIRDIHFETSINQDCKPSVNRRYLYILSLIGIFIIIIAVVNFINLTTARSSRRSSEVGLRVVFGSTRKILISQFLGESVLTTFLAVIIAILFLLFLVPVVNRITGLSLSVSTLFSFGFILVIIVSTFITGILAGFYPALLLSSMGTSSILREKRGSGKFGSLVKRILVTLQFFIAVFMLSATIEIFMQFRFLHASDLGFQKEDIMIIRNTAPLKKHMATFLAEVKKIPGVENVSNSNAIPGYPNSGNGFKVEGESTSGTYSIIETNWIDYTYTDLYDLKFKEGRTFNLAFSSDSMAAIINEAAVKKMGLKNPLGTRLMNPDGRGNFNYHPIIGVVKDFHFDNLRADIQPYIMLVKPVNHYWFGPISVRLGKGEKLSSIKKIEETWKRLTENSPLEYSFLEDELRNLYKDEQVTAKLSGGFTVLAVLIACLGLYGLISFFTEQKTKEIGIRKILGASISNIVLLLSSETVKLVIIASLLSWPVSWYFLKGWLTDFAYRIDLNPLVLILTSIAILGLSLVTISGHVLYAASRNPADSLRYE